MVGTNSKWDCVVVEQRETYLIAFIILIVKHIGIRPGKHDTRHTTLNTHGC